jgi:hypothetical protein
LCGGGNWAKIARNIIEGNMRRRRGGNGKMNGKVEGMEEKEEERKCN